MMDIEDVTRFFFEASRNCWAGQEGERQGIKIDIPEFSGAKAWEYRADLFRYLDLFVVANSGGYSVGQTMIWCDENPVWIMQYRGAYHERAIPFLKEALLSAYNRQIFLGGRGPVGMGFGNGLVYWNRATGDFRDFQGKEEIKDAASGMVLGSHQYAGHTLL